MTTTTCEASYTSDTDYGLSGYLFESVRECGCKQCTELLHAPVYVKYANEYAENMARTTTTMYDILSDYHFSYTGGAWVYLAHADDNHNDDSLPWNSADPYPDYALSHDNPEHDDYIITIA